MGEYSRSIGEMGENISEFFLTQFGWRGLSNVEFSCHERTKHNCKKHGIDFITSYLCPLENDTLQIVFVSIKYNQPDSIKSHFLKFSETLIKSASCFINDEKFKNITNHVNYKKKRISHLLLWLNHDREDKFSLVESLSNVNNDIASLNFESLYLVDNQKITFIKDILGFTKSTFPNSTIEYFYPSTGINERIDGGRKLSGKILPIHLLNSPILPIKVTQENNIKTLVLFVNESFDEETLKRSMGLSQSLTGGWCSKIVICFPDYQSSKHFGIKEQVFFRFHENQFSDMVEIKSYNNSFKSLEKKENVIQSEPIELSPKFNIETMLPFGDQLRQLLIQSYIYKVDLQTLLNRRGVFLGKNLDKLEAIPIITKTLISPREFEFLRKKQSSKENAEKIVQTNLNVKSGAEIQETIKKINFERVNTFIANSLPNCEIVNSIDSLMESTGSYRIPFQLKRQDLSRDWASSKSIHAGEVVISIKPSSDGLGKIQIDTVYSTSETKSVAKQIIKAFELELKNNDIISKNEVQQRMVANEFSIIGRNDFLLSFKETDNQKLIRFKTITSIDFSLDEEHPKKLPSDLASMKDRLDESIFKGKNLEDIDYIKDRKYREILIFNSFTINYLFDFEGLKGEFQIEYGFLDAKGKGKEEAMDSEFEYKILEIHPFIERNLSTKELHELKGFLKQEFSNLRTEKLQKIDRRINVQLSLLDSIN
jgi:hypothetical protein